MDKKIGNYSFIVGVALAVVLGIFTSKPFSLGEATPWLVSLMILLGIAVGLLNVSGKETKEFLIISGILIVAAYAGSASSILGEVLIIGGYLQGIFAQVLAFVVPATIVVALKDIAELSHNP